MGQELEAAGVNLLLGPTLDVLDVPAARAARATSTRARFGGDPSGSARSARRSFEACRPAAKARVVTAAKHFPGQGGSDRGPEDEVATVQKSVEQLRQIELAPFAAVTAGGRPGGARHHRRADDLPHPLPRFPGQHPRDDPADQPGAPAAGPDGTARVRAVAGGGRRADQRRSSACRRCAATTTRRSANSRTARSRRTRSWPATICCISVALR